MIVLTPIYFILPRRIAYEIPKNWRGPTIG